MKDDQVLEILALLKGELKGKAKKELSERIAADPELSDLKDTIRHLIDAGEEIRSDYGLAARSLARGLFNDYLEKIKKPESKRGVIIFDSSQLPLPAGVRKAGVDSRRRRYRFDDFDLDISTYPLTPDSFELIGQLTIPSAGDEIKVTAIRGKQRIGTEVDTHNIFRFERLPAGKYTIEIAKLKGLMGTITFEL